MTDSLLKTLLAPKPECPRDMSLSVHLERFQSQPWHIKLWRYRHYIPVLPLAFKSWITKLILNKPRDSFTFYVGIYKSSAQVKMKWLYSMEEMLHRLRNKQQL